MVFFANNIAIQLDKCEEYANQHRNALDKERYSKNKSWWCCKCDSRIRLFNRDSAVGYSESAIRFESIWNNTIKIHKCILNFIKAYKSPKRDT